MSDSITKCTVFKFVDGTIDHYIVEFKCDGYGCSSDPDLCHPVNIRIRPTDMVNPTDLTELKTLACTRASKLKNFMLVTPVATDIPDIVGDVTL